MKSLPDPMSLSPSPFFEPPLIILATANCQFHIPGCFTQTLQSLALFYPGVKLVSTFLRKVVLMGWRSHIFCLLCVYLYRIDLVWIHTRIVTLSPMLLFCFLCQVCSDNQCFLVELQLVGIFGTRLKIHFFVGILMGVWERSNGGDLFLMECKQIIIIPYTIATQQELMYFDSLNLGQQNPFCKSVLPFTLSQISKDMRIIVTKCIGILPLLWYQSKCVFLIIKKLIDTEQVCSI